MAGKRRMETGRFIPFDVIYADGTRSSNRRVPADILGGLDGDEPARSLIEEQERRIAEQSGKPPRVIASIVRSGAKAK